MSEPTVRRQRRKMLTDKMIAGMKFERPPLRPDPELGSHYVRLQPKGPPHHFYAVTRDAYGKQRWVKIGSTAELSIEESRERVRDVIKRLRAGQEPFARPPPKPDTVADVVETYFKRYVEPRGIRTAAEKRRVVHKHILPAWRDRSFAEIGRADIARLCDSVEDEHGKWVSDSVLIELSSIAHWYASRSDTYTPPFTRNMRRVSAHERKRSRLLSDDELRAVWKSAEANGAFGAMVRLLLLTGQRRYKVATMRFDDVAVDGTWSIPAEKGEKGHAGVLNLPGLASDIINAQPRFSSNPHVFPASRGNGPLRGYSRLKAAFDKKSCVSDYTLHDLRRCARSLMARAGVQPHIAERVLGHAIGGVAGIYDRYRYDHEKADALQRLATLIEMIVNPSPGDKVVQLRGATKS
jgi:integrase